jgi:hypothetical protein
MALYPELFTRFKWMSGVAHWGHPEFLPKATLYSTLQAYVVVVIIVIIIIIVIVAAATTKYITTIYAETGQFLTGMYLF